MWPNSGLRGRRRPTINGYGFRLIQTELGSVVRWLRRKLYDLKKIEIHNLTERSLVINPKYRQIPMTIKIEIPEPENIPFRTL